MTDPTSRRGLLAAVLPRTLRGRLALTYVTLAVVLWAVFGGFLIVAGRSLYVVRLSDQLAAQANLVADAVAPELEAGGGAGTVDSIVKRLGSHVDARVTVIAADGTVLGDSDADPGTMGNHAGRPEVREALASGTGREQRHSATLRDDFLYVAVPISEAPGAVARMALPLTEVNAAVRSVQWGVAGAAAIAGCVSAVVAAGIAARIAGPLDDLRVQASAVATGRLDVSVTPASTRELGELGRAFNVMTARLRELVAESEEGRARLELMLANLSDGVVITDRAATVLRINASAAGLFDVAEEEAVGRPLSAVARDHDLVDLLRSAMATGATGRATIDYRGERRVIDVTAQALGEGDGQVGLLVIRDVTELRRLERMRQEFVANVSHELRTPLASIRVLLETLQAGAATDEAVAGEFFGRAVEEVDRETRLVDELLELARLDAARVTLALEEVDPAELLAGPVDRLRPQAERAGLDLRLEAPDALPPVRVDRGRIDHVVLNLVHNAIKFTPAGGSVVVGASAAEGEVTVWVRDTGVGIAEEERERLFERFYKGASGAGPVGSGLGLSIAKHIVQVHGGRIWAEPNGDGVGATFRFALPVAAAKAEAGSDGT